MTKPEPILLVDQDSEERDLIGGWLENDGYDVLACPGPSAPDYTCIGGEGGHCPLVDPVGLVIVDLWLGGDAMLQGTAAVDLLGYYLSTGKPVIAICHGGEPVGLFLEDHLVAVEGHPDRGELLEAVRALTSA
jgi:hypothetical protein